MFKRFTARQVTPASGKNFKSLHSCWRSSAFESSRSISIVGAGRRRTNEAEKVGQQKDYIGFQRPETVFLHSDSPSDRIDPRKLVIYQEEELEGNDNQKQPERESTRSSKQSSGGSDGSGGEEQGGLSTVDPHPDKIYLHQHESLEEIEADVEESLVKIQNQEQSIREKKESVATATITKGAEEEKAALLKKKVHPHDLVPDGPNKVKKGEVRLMNPEEQFALAYQKYLHNKSQDGAYIGSTTEDREVHAVDTRRRREIERVKPMKALWKGYEPSFRRLPQGANIPTEAELQSFYPRRCSTELEWDNADCADNTTLGPQFKPEPIKFAKIFPNNYDPEKEHPFVIVIPDGQGLPLDVEDVVANFFERQVISKQMDEQGVVLFFPLIAVRHQQPDDGETSGIIEGVIARFCDWTCQNYKVENGKCHLWGKGNGANAVLKTCMEFKGLAHSATCITGRRQTSPINPFNNPMHKAKNVEGTHLLIVCGGKGHRIGMTYQYKAMCDGNQVNPPVRLHHYADVCENQLLHALNPHEWGSHLKFFRTNDALVQAEMDQLRDVYEDPKFTWGSDALDEEKTGAQKEK